MFIIFILKIREIIIIFNIKYIYDVDRFKLLKNGIVLNFVEYCIFVRLGLKFFLKGLIFKLIYMY